MNSWMDRVVEQHGVLRDDTDGGPQRLLRHLAQVQAVDADAPGVDVVETVQQTRQRRLSGTGVADHGDRAAGGNLEVDAVQDLAARVVAESNALEADARMTRHERHGAGAILHVRVLIQQREQPSQVGERLLDLAIHHAEEEQRRRELQQVGVDQHQVAYREPAADHAGRRAPHHRGDADRHDDGLAEVEQGEGLLCQDVGVLQAAQALVVARRFVLLVVEVLDGLVVDQRVDGELVGTRVGLDRGPVIPRPPFGHDEAPRRVGHQRGEDDQREAPVVRQHQEARDQQHLDGGRHDGVERPVEQVGDRGAAALEIAGHPARAPVEVEP